MVCANSVVPSDALRAVFTAEVLARLRKSKAPSESLRWRLKVLDACGPMPTDWWKAVEVRAWRAQKAAWEAYLSAAFACGLLDDPSGTDLRARLTGLDNHNFRGAMAECMACWFLTCRIRVRVDRVPQPLQGTSPDLRAVFPGLTDVGIEVKAPFRERPEEGRVWCGDDSDKIIRCVEKADKQLTGDRPNLLVIAPMLRTTMFDDRETSVKALFFESQLVFDVDTREGRLLNPRSELRPTGKLLKTKLPSGRSIKQDGLPACRRISVVLFIEETLKHKFPDPFLRMLRSHADTGELGMDWETFARQKCDYLSTANDTWIAHNVMVLHNPYAHYAIPDSVFGHYTQFVPRGDVMVWSDGYKCAM